MSLAMTTSLPVLVDMFPATRWRYVRAMSLVMAGSIVLALAAKVQIPLQPVPFTLQTLAVMLIGAGYGARLGMTTIALYLFEGAIGLPVFAGGILEGGGIQHLLGPTGGYLISFIPAAGLMGLLARRGWDRSAISMTAALLLGNGIIFTIGLAWLSRLVGITTALQVGLFPFLPGLALKTGLAIWWLPIVWRRIKSDSNL